jgi:hypothetical protein
MSEQSGWLPYIDAILQGLFDVLVPIGVAYIAKKTKNQDLRQALDMALQRAPGVVIAGLANESGQIDSALAKSHAASYVMSTVPQALKNFNITPDLLHTMVSAELQKALPTLVIGPEVKNGEVK